MESTLYRTSLQWSLSVSGIFKNCFDAVYIHERLVVWFQVGDVVDARDLSMGAWFESKIMKVKKTTSVKETTDKDAQPTTNSKPVLSESSVNSSDNNNVKMEKSEKLIEDIKEDMQTDEMKEKTPVVSVYDKLFEGIVKDDGFVYHIVYEG